ncbi:MULTISPECIES: Flp family type IVb pilin [unclassified Campylobacter]|uniref:Flp family type IVb pilin n=1 Tax=unclassified Campylobacter TaxID=2593542 RepID=UPI001BDA27AA|nr:MULTISPECIES: Flp family type IVb pilin [unclassified Campylobacter]MBT0881542.1 Flp family type IVb pilin [Campylobacter sp. 2018MI27]MBT0883856.1 Flp family type IVb pilin [Campylobacter sp. 2018MI10]MBZ8006786.1 Flp family type IVb pilin [Campylobacter sp. RM9334]
MNQFIIKTYCKFLIFIKDTKAVTAIEYALIAVAISAMLFLVLGSGDDGLISKIKDSFKSIQDALTITKEESGK